MTALTRLLALHPVPADARLHGRVRRGGGADRRLHRLARQRAADHQGRRGLSAEIAACASSSRPAGRRACIAAINERVGEPGLEPLSAARRHRPQGRRQPGHDAAGACRQPARGRCSPTCAPRTAPGPAGAWPSACRFRCRGGLTLVVGRDIEDQRQFAATMGRVALVERRAARRRSASAPAS